jgi:hypothetical protein
MTATYSNVFQRSNFRHLRIGWKNWKKLIPGSLHPRPFAEVAAVQRHELKTWEHTW